MHVSNCHTPREDDDYSSPDLLPNGMVKKGTFTRGRIDKVDSGCSGVDVDDAVYHVAFRLESVK